VIRVNDGFEEAHKIILVTDENFCNR
jgi:hypothetical protein